MGLLFYLLVLISWPLLGVFLPRRLAACFFGWLSLGYGLAWLQTHVLSFQEQNDRLGIGAIVGAGWFAALLIGVVVTALKHMSAKPPVERFERQPWPTVLAWTIPLGILAAGLFFHWLSNRLAGFSPAWIPHALAIGSGLVIAAGGIWLRRFRPARGLLVVGFGSALAALTVMAAARGLMAFSATSRTGSCAVTLAGNERSRPAHNGFDMSPLISRSKGRSPLDHPADVRCR